MSWAFFLLLALPQVFPLYQLLCFPAFSPLATRNLLFSLLIFPFPQNKKIRHNREVMADYQRLLVT